MSGVAGVGTRPGECGAAAVATPRASLALVPHALTRVHVPAEDGVDARSDEQRLVRDAHGLSRALVLRAGMRGCGKA